MNLASLTLTIATLIASALQAEDREKAPLTMPQALKLGVEKLTTYTDESEAGQDRAAGLYAAAKKIETEHALAQRNLEQVIVLEEWRDAIAKCRQGSCSLAYIINGGGTMYAHGAQRDCAEVEDFLTMFAKRLPLAEGMGNAKATKQITSAIAFIKNLKPTDLGDDDTNKKVKTDLANEAKRVIEMWESLQYMLDHVPAAEAVKIATFATDSLSWLKEG